MAADKTSSEVRLTDEEFMEVIRDFPGVYDKNHEDFRDKSKKEECWEKISDILNVRIEDTKRRYETIRTRLSRHLKRIKEGYWSIDSKDIKLDFLHWLMPYIKTREAPFQFKNDIKRDYSDPYDEEDVQRSDSEMQRQEGGGEPHFTLLHREESSDVTRASMITIGDGKTSSNGIEEDPISSLPVVTSVSSVVDFETGNRKRKFESVNHLSLIHI